MNCSLVCLIIPDVYYVLQVLQTLGMPLSLVSLTALVAGPTAMVLLPLVGWLSDKGSNPQRRKTGAVVFVAGLLCSGMHCVLAANVLHLNYLLDYNSRMDFSSNFSGAFSWNASVSIDPATKVSVFAECISKNRSNFQHSMKYFSSSDGLCF